MSNLGSTALTLRFRGCRGSTPVPAREMLRYGGNTSCVEVRCGEEILVLDAGTGIRNLGQDLLAEFGDHPIEANLLISHTHWDHIQGLPFFAPAYLAHHRVHILSARGTGPRLERALRNQMDPIHFPVGLDLMPGLAGVAELDSDQTRLGSFSIGVTSLNHPGGCAGFRIEANGSSMAYLPDHEPYQSGGELARAGHPRRQALVEFLRDVDLLILDTQYTEAEYSRRIGWGHGCLPESVALAIDAGARRLLLFHHDPLHDDDQIDEMVEAAREMAGSFPLLVRGAAENETIKVAAKKSSGVSISAPGPHLKSVAA